MHLARNFKISSMRTTVFLAFGSFTPISLFSGWNCHMLSVFVLFQACCCVLLPLTPALTGGANRNLDLPYFLQDYVLRDMVISRLWPSL